MNTKTNPDKTATALSQFTRGLDLASAEHRKIEQVTALFSRNIMLAMAVLGGGKVALNRRAAL